MTSAPDAATRDVVLRIERVSRSFDETRAVDDVSIDVVRGELLVLLGPSGCGKTTTLRMIAGFEQPDSGRIVLEGRDVTAEPPQRRATGMVFQNYALFPHLNVFENVAFGLKARGTPRDQLGARVRQALALVDLDGYEERRVQALSGGQQQRVALARALAPEPPLLLLDEPLSNLDAALREKTRTELRALLHRLDMTAVFVTHDQEEAFALADRIAVMRDGRVQQIGSPVDLYREPVSEFVAGFLGRANFLDAVVVRVDERDGAVLCSLSGWGGKWWATPCGGAPPQPGTPIRVMTRPEELELLPPPERGGGTLSRIELGLSDITQTTTPTEQPTVAIVASKHFVGSAVRYGLEPSEADRSGDALWSDEQPVMPPLLVSARELGFEIGDHVSVSPRMDASVRCFPASDAPRPS